MLGIYLRFLLENVRATLYFLFSKLYSIDIWHFRIKQDITCFLLLLACRSQVRAVPGAPVLDSMSDFFLMAFFEFVFEF